MKRLVLSALSIALISTIVYAGVNWIDYSSGDFECTNGYKDNLVVCNKNSSRFLGDFCRSQVAGICK